MKEDIKVYRTKEGTIFEVAFLILALVVWGNRHQTLFPHTSTLQVTLMPGAHLWESSFHVVS